jgi:hypothetical protein
MPEPEPTEPDETEPFRVCVTTRFDTGKGQAYSATYNAPLTFAEVRGTPLEAALTYLAERFAPQFDADAFHFLTLSFLVTRNNVPPGHNFTPKPLPPTLTRDETEGSI